MNGFPVGKIAEKAVCKSVYFGSIALYFECRINKNTLLQTAFSPILHHWVCIFLYAQKVIITLAILLINTHSKL